MEKKDKRKAIIGTFIFHIVLLLVLILLAFKTPLPLPEEMGVLVDFGGGGGGGGQSGIVNQTTAHAVANADQIVENPNAYKTPTVTQNVEQTEVISPQTTSQHVVSEPVVDPRITNFWQNKQTTQHTGSGTGAGAGSGSGIGSGTGSGSGSGDGSGVGSGTGSGTGPGFNLHGRSAKFLPIPEYTEQEQGIVVVDVWVDRNGNVTKAISGARGTTTPNASLWRKAQQAALQAKFSINTSAPEEQKGTITYTFMRIGN
jgi:TonB family protein